MRHREVAFYDTGTIRGASWDGAELVKLFRKRRVDAESQHYGFQRPSGQKMKKVKPSRNHNNPPHVYNCQSNAVRDLFI